MLSDWEQQTRSRIEREFERHAQELSPRPAAPSGRRRGRVLDTSIDTATLISAFEVLVGSYSRAARWCTAMTGTQTPLSGAHHRPGKDKK